MSPPDSIATALRNHAEGSCWLAAAAEFLIAQSWLHRDDFTSRFVTVHHGHGGGNPIAVGIPVDLRDTLTGLDHRNASLVIKAIAHATGQTHPRTGTP